MATDLSNIENLFDEKKSIQKDYHSQTPCSFPINRENLFGDIYKKAEQMGITIDPLDIRAIASHIFNVKIIEKDLGKSASGFLEKIGDQWCVYINKYENETRKRFTIAHELAHLIFHSEKYSKSDNSLRDQIFFRDENTSPLEKQANDFASELLMPEGLFQRYIKEGDNTIIKLAERFNLSTAAVKYRAYKLGLISRYEL